MDLQIIASQISFIDRFISGATLQPSNGVSHLKKVCQNGFILHNLATLGFSYALGFRTSTYAWGKAQEPNMAKINYVLSGYRVMWMSG